MLYSGREKDHHQGVGILLNKNAAKALIGWKLVSERIITARFATRHAKATVVQVYAPTELTCDGEKDRFYEQLQDELNMIPSYDIKVVIGDFNAKIDDNRRGLHTMLGPFGSANLTNDNGERFILSCCTNGLSIGNTFFRHKQIHKVTWTSPDGGTSNEIDYICISSRWRSSVYDVRTFRGADVGSDHNLVIARIRLRLKKTTTVTSVRPFATEKLKDPDIVNSFRMDVRNRFASLQHATDFTEQWKLFQDSIKDSATHTIGLRWGSQRKRWITDNSWQLIDKRKSVKIIRDQVIGEDTWQVKDEEYRTLDKEVKKSCRKDKRKWLDEKGAEAEEAASHNDMRMLYRIVRDLTGAQTNTNVPVRGKDGKVLLTEREQSARWVEHFNEVLNQPEPDELFSFDNESDLGPIEASLEDFQISETAKPYVS